MDNHDYKALAQQLRAALKQAYANAGFDERIERQCAEALEAARVLGAPLHADGCCCSDCDPHGLVQSYYARPGRVL